MSAAPSLAHARVNRLLAALPDSDWDRVRRHLEPVFLSPGETLFEAGLPRHHAYFPTTAIVSIECPTADGASTEIALVGREGIVGIALFMGGQSRPSRGVVEAQGWAFRLAEHVLNEEFARGGALQHLLLLYTQALLTLTAQTAVCYRFHTLGQQLCRWLLLTLDRSTSSVVRTTHEKLALMLGVRREGVTEALGRLQHAGLIHCGRGQITVLDRAGLEAKCCECYAVVKREFDRLLPQATRRSTGRLSRRCFPSGCRVSTQAEERQDGNDDDDGTDDVDESVHERSLRVGYRSESTGPLDLHALRVR
jgi:CRP-like cAMP-binding protein